jgi:hypothetical protein
VDNGGSGDDSLLSGGMLGISQTVEVHQQISRFLSRVRQIQSDYAKHPHEYALPRISAGLEPVEIQKLKQALNQDVTLDFSGELLNRFVEKLSTRYAIPMELDRPWLEAAGIEKNTPVSIKVTNMPLGKSLKRALRDLSLTFVLRHDVVLITTNEESELALQTNIYPVRDLLPADATDEVVEAELAKLRDTLQKLTGIPKPGWLDDGGVGNITALISHKALVISQPDEVFEEVDALLADLRKKNVDSRRQLRVKYEPTYPMAMYRLSCDATGRPKASSAELVTAIKRLLPHVDWTLAGTTVLSLSDRIIIRHEARTLEQIMDLNRIELNGLLGELRPEKIYFTPTGRIDASPPTRGTSPETAK